MAKDVHQGGCLCGAVRFETHGPARWTGYCHCQSCRRHTGAPVSAFAGFATSQVRIVKGAIAKYASSTDVARGFCGQCGSTLSYEGARWPGEFHVHVGAFDDPQAFPPTGEGFTNERLPWLHVTLPAPT